MDFFTDLRRIHIFVISNHYTELVLEITEIWMWTYQYL